jgi:hypothetical protein
MQRAFTRKRLADYSDMEKKMAKGLDLLDVGEGEFSNDLILQGLKERFDTERREIINSQHRNHNQFSFIRLNHNC